MHGNLRIPLTGKEENKNQGGPYGRHILAKLWMNDNCHS